MEFFQKKKWNFSKKKIYIYINKQIEIKADS